MRLMNLITECTDYSVMSHENFCDTGNVYANDVEKSNPLKCNLRKDDLGLRNTATDTNEALLESFVSACAGNDPRWKLLRVDIRNGKLHLTFADTLTKNIGNHSAYYQTEVIEFCSGELLFSLCLDHKDGHHSEKYDFEYFGGMDTEIDEFGRKHIATIVEHYEGQPSRYQYLYFGSDGKYYLDQEVYNL